MLWIEVEGTAEGVVVSLVVLLLLFRATFEALTPYFNPAGRRD